MTHKISIYNCLLPDTSADVKSGIIPFWNHSRKTFSILSHFRKFLTLIVYLLAFIPSSELFSHNVEIGPENTVLNNIFSVNREIGSERTSQRGLNASGDCNGLPFSMNGNRLVEYPHFLKANKYRLLLASIQTRYWHHCSLEAENLLENPSIKSCFRFTRAIQIIHDRTGLFTVQKRR